VKRFWILDLGFWTGRLQDIRLSCLILSVSLFAIYGSVNAQQPRKVPRIGILTPGPVGPRSHFFEAFRQGLRELGYVEGRNIIVDIPEGDGKLERLPNLAADLLGLKVDIMCLV
jgi:putative ABC transport system substrate-binding protein